MEKRAEKETGSKRAYWQDHIDSWQQSGQSQQRYCQRQGIALATFGYWRRKLKTPRTDKPRFFPLVVSGRPFVDNAVRTNCTPLRLVLGDHRFTIEIDEHFSPAVLREVITTLEQL
jgi:hypothetical protein